MSAMPPDLLRMAARGQLSLSPGARIVLGNPDESRQAKRKAERRKANKSARVARRRNRR